MVFVETPTFTRQVTELLSDEEYRALQNTLVEDPEHGDLIKGGGGIRKVRHALQGRGRSGGARAIYYWVKDISTRSTCWWCIRSPRGTT
jgi:hypothetical protein